MTNTIIIPTEERDIIQRADGTYWLIVAIRESYATEGWLSVLCVEQVEPPKGVDDNAD